jgi:hypothetical protein
VTFQSDYAAIANEAYSADPLWTDPPIANGRRFTDGQGGTAFEVIDDPVATRHRREQEDLRQRLRQHGARQ